MYYLLNAKVDHVLIKFVVNVIFVSLADGKIRVEDILKLASQSKEEDETGDEAGKD